MTTTSGPRPERARFGSERPGSSPELTSAGGPDVGDALDQLLDQVVHPLMDPISGPDSLRGKVAVVTGGSTGIGRAVVQELAQIGVNVAFCFLDRGPADREGAKDVARKLRELEVRCFFRPCDVRDPIEVEDFVTEVHEKMGGMHILVNNAGIHEDRALWRMSDDEWSTVIDTNLNGVFYFTRAVAPYFRDQEFGKIVNITSVHGLRSEFGLSNYCSSKAGVIGLTRSSAVELGPKNINVNAVAPGYIRTTRLTEGVSAEILDQARDRSVLGRLGDPQDVAHVVSFLCSEAARHITGAVIPVDGGYLL